MDARCRVRRSPGPFLQDLHHRRCLPCCTPRLGRDAHRVEDARDLPVAETLVSKRNHPLNRLSLALADNDPSVDDSLAVPGLAAPIPRGPVRSSELDPVTFQSRHYRRSGGKNQRGDLPRREALFEVFLPKENLISIQRNEDKRRNHGGSCWRKLQFRIRPDWRATSHSKILSQHLLAPNLHHCGEGSIGGGTIQRTQHLW